MGGTLTLRAGGNNIYVHVAFLGPRIARPLIRT